MNNFNLNEKSDYALFSIFLQLLQKGEEIVHFILEPHLRLQGLEHGTNLDWPQAFFEVSLSLKFGGNRTYSVVTFHSCLRVRRNNIKKNVFNRNRTKKLQLFGFNEHGRNFSSRIFHFLCR